jgi:hypothetical protein
MKVGDLVKDVAFNIGGIGIILKINRFRHIYEVRFSDGHKRWLYRGDLQVVKKCP